MSQNQQNPQNHFPTWKVANRLLSNGKRLRAVACFSIDIQKVLHCFEGFVIKIYSFLSAITGFTRATETICQSTEPIAMTNDSTTVTTKIHGCRSMR